MRRKLVKSTGAVMLALLAALGGMDISAAPIYVYGGNGSVPDGVFSDVENGQKAGSSGKNENVQQGDSDSLDENGLKGTDVQPGGADNLPGNDENDNSGITPGATTAPTEVPGDATPTAEPTEDPKPTADPAGEPTAAPKPTTEPTTEPTDEPKPTTDPAGEPTATPKPTKQPKPTTEPTDEPKPTADPAGEPTATPKPTKQPKPTTEPTGEPTIAPTGEPVTEPTPQPEEPTEIPTPTPMYKVDIPTESNSARYQYLFGMEPREITMDTPPEGFETKEAAASHMKTFNVPVWKMTASGGKYASTYSITVHEKLARSVKCIFKEIYALDIKFPIKQLNGFMYRKVGGVGLSRSTLMSVHSFGAAIDINPGDYDNDYFLGKGNDLRDKSNPYCIPDEVIEIFKKYGWFWGGEFEICADTMHFQYLGLDMLHYQGNSPFRTLKVKSGYMKGIDVRNLQQRLCEVGYSVTVDGVYGNRTMAAVRRYQKKRGLPVTGEVDYKTWETIINETHYMSYVF